MVWLCSAWLVRQGHRTIALGDLCGGRLGFLSYACMDDSLGGALHDAGGDRDVGFLGNRPARNRLGAWPHTCGVIHRARISPVVRQTSLWQSALMSFVGDAEANAQPLVVARALPSRVLSVVSTVLLVLWIIVMFFFFYVFSFLE